MNDIKLKVPSIDCAACAMKIDKCLKKIGVKSTTNAALKIVKAKYDESKTTEEDILKAIKSVGYGDVKVS